MSEDDKPMSDDVVDEKGFMIYTSIKIFFLFFVSIIFFTGHDIE